MLPATHPDLALVDIHLADGPTGVDVGRRLAQSGIAVVFMTANLKRIPPDFAGALGAIGKPYSLSGVEAALNHVAGLVHGRPSDVTVPPANFLLAPAPVRRARGGVVGEQPRAAPVVGGGEGVMP